MVIVEVRVRARVVLRELMLRPKGGRSDLRDRSKKRNKTIDY